MDDTEPEPAEPVSTALPSTGRFQSRWVRLLLGLFVGFAFLGAIELGLRWTLGPPGAPVQVYSGLDGQRDEWFVQHPDGFQTTYQSSERGDRGTWIPSEIRGTRVAVFGGSSVRGGSTNLMAEQEFAFLLRDALDIEVYNLGRISLDSHDLVAIMEEMREIPMDAWVVYTGHNDFGNTYFHQRYSGWSGGMLARLQGGLERLQMYWQLQNAIGMTQANSADPNPRKQFEADGLGVEQKQQALTYLEQNLRRMAWLAADYGVELILVVPVSRLEVAPKGRDCEAPDSCAIEYFRAGELSKARDADTIPLRAPSYAQEVVRRVAQDEGLQLVDAEAGLPRAEGPTIPPRIISWMWCLCGGGSPRDGRPDCADTQGSIGVVRLSRTQSPEYWLR